MVQVGNDYVTQWTRPVDRLNEMVRWLSDGVVVDETEAIRGQTSPLARPGGAAL